LKLVTKFNNLELDCPEELLSKLIDFAKEHHPLEHGGFLLGRYSDNLKTLFLEDYVVPKVFNGFPTLFERSVKGLKTFFKKITRDKNLYYVGEWHTHPNGSSMFSSIDLQAMIDIANCSTVNIKNPILLIISLTKENVNDFAFYLYNEGELIKYEQN